MNNKFIIISVTLFASLAVLSYFLLFRKEEKPKLPSGPPAGSGANQTPPSSPTYNGSTTNGDSPTIVDGVMTTYMENVADKFFAQFDATGAYRCGVIADAYGLTTNQLQYFVDYFTQQYGLTPTQKMDTAWVWCYANTNDTKLYDRLKALE